MIGHSIQTAVSSLRQGKIVAFPTETYYGLAVDPENDEAVTKLYSLKNRPSEKPLLLLIESREQLQDLVIEVPFLFEQLMDTCWPGPLTLIFSAQGSVSTLITGNTETVGVRVSSEPLAMKLVSAFGRPITATSANLAGLPPSATAREVMDTFGERVDYIIDGGDSPAGLCSTIVAFENSQLTVLRNGQIDLAKIIHNR